ncbi:MAG: rod shape-determining protein RodA [Bacteroidota bacterium]
MKLLSQRSRINYQLEDKFDITAFLCMLLLFTIGLMAIYSSTIHHPTAGGNFQKQLLWGIASLIVFFVTCFLHPRTFSFLALPSYILSILLLVAVFAVGKKVYGARSWLDLGFVGFQPSEFAKIATILLLSKYLSMEKTDINSVKDLIIALAIGFFPVALILLEPDMGTSIVFAAIILALLYWKGIDLFYLFVVLSPGISIFASMFGYYVLGAVLLLIIAGLFFFKKNLFFSASIFVTNLASGFFFDALYRALSPHQQKRLTTFIDPNADPLGSGYNAIQAKVAIGSGGLFGKGFLAGNQTQLRFIPEQWTDFIYCVIGEEFGFIGSVFTITLFLVLFLRILKTASMVREKSEFNSLVVIGVLCLLFVHFAINIGMDLGVMPVIGLPLPFLSYGGSSLMVNMFLMGIVANIYRNRKQYA